VVKLPDGTEWRLVPEVATEEMVGSHGWKPGDLTEAAINEQGMAREEAWAELLAAAPQPPVDEMVASVSEILTEFSDVECSFDTIARAIVARLIGEKPLDPPVTEEQSARNYSPTLSTEDDR